MRTDQPDLAHRLVGADYRLWSDADPLSDTVRGPADLARRLTAAQARSAEEVSPGVVVAGGSMIACTWTATPPDGTSVTGIDVHLLGADAEVTRTWSVTGERADTIEVTPASVPTDAATLARVSHAWTDMWNGQTALVHDLVSEDFRIWFGALRSADDSIVGPQAMEDYVIAFRAQLGDVRFSESAELVLDPSHGRAAVVWAVTLPPEARPPQLAGVGELHLGGIDVFQFAADRIARAWSITGRRPHTLPDDA